MTTRQQLGRGKFREEEDPFLLEVGDFICLSTCSSGIYIYIYTYFIAWYLVREMVMSIVNLRNVGYGWLRFPDIYQSCGKQMLVLMLGGWLSSRLEEKATFVYHHCFSIDIFLSTTYHLYIKFYRFVQFNFAAVKFKPVAAHAEDMMRSKQKKDGAKTVRADRDALMQALFHAFEKHQYYRLQDLQQLTQQPAGYVKELLQDIAVYNTAPPHKSMWELKPEYRNYGSIDIEHATPSCMVYLRAGHIPHLTWDVVQKWLKLDQKPIFQLTLPGLIESEPQLFVESPSLVPSWFPLVEDLANIIDENVLWMLDLKINAMVIQFVMVDFSFLFFPYLLFLIIIDLHDFVDGKEVDRDELKKLVHQTFAPLPPNRLRYASGAFDPSMILFLSQLGIDLFDSSYVVKISEEAKAFLLADDYPYSCRYELMDFKEDRYADDFTTPFDICECYTCKNYTKGYLHHLNNAKELLCSILLVMLRRVDNETELERNYREAREKLNEWNSNFWAEHNQDFEIKKAKFIEKKKSELGRIDSVSAEDMSEFYRDFLNTRHTVLMTYNKEWYQRNLALIWPAIKVNLIRFMRLLRK
uniref:General transcription factor IIF subunit 2 n=1 Tax=Heterorhabditis bacteriophora TaxID=37862 RepID=A0A1I7WJG0_HETBA